jgi:hypothetical protein
MLPTIFQTNTVNNTTATSLNMKPSTVNALGITITPTNTGTNVETYEAGGNFTAAEAMIGNGTGAIQSSPAFIYASSPQWLTTPVAYGGDYCVVLNNIWKTMTPGSTVIWDIPGKLVCNSNPWAGITPSAYIPGTLNLTVPVAFFTTAAWVKPPKVNVVGTGESRSNEDGTQGTAIVACPSSSISPCTGSFPFDTPVYAVVSNVQNFAYTGSGTTTRDESLTIDCAYVQGARGYMDYATQENGGATNITARNCQNNGVDFDLGTFQGSGSNGDSDNSRFDGLNLGANTPPGGVTGACTVGSVVLRMNYPAGGPGPKSVSNVTANAIECTALTTEVPLNHVIEINGCCTEFTGKMHTEETSRSAVIFGTKTILGTANITTGSPTSTLTYVSGDDWAASCTGTIYVENIPYPVATCPSGTTLTFTGSPSSLSNARYSLDLHVGATNERVETADHCCSANFVGTASGTTFTITSGAAPQANWTGNVVLGTASYVIASTTPTTIVTTTTITGSPTTGSYGSIFEIDSASNTQSICINNLKALSPNKPSMMIIDGFNSIIPVLTDSSMVSYCIDQNDRVIADDSGTNPVNLVGGAKLQSGLTGTVTLGPTTLSVGGSSIALNACTAYTATIAGVTSADNPSVDFSADPTATTGYFGTNIVTIYKWASTNTVNVKLCNWSTSAGITPTAITLNVRVPR